MTQKKERMRTDEVTVHVDRIWSGLGRFGRFQLRQLIVLLISSWSCGFHMLSIVFIGYRPSFQCANITGNTNSSGETWQEYGQCSIKTYTNTSGVVSVTETACPNGWSFKDEGPFNAERSLVSEWQLVCDRQELTELSQTLLMIGQAIGAFVATSLADKYGRKPMHIGCHILVFLVSLGTAFVSNYPEFAALRFVLGVVQQGTDLPLAIMLLELFPTELRGNLEVTALLFWTTGIAIVTPIAYLAHMMPWRNLQLILACLSAWSLAEWWLIDESLRWLIANKKVDQARTVIQKACRINKKDYDAIAEHSNFRKWAEECERVTNHNGATELHPMTNSDNKLNENLDDGQSFLVAKTNAQKHASKVVKYGFLDIVRSRRIFIVSLIMWFAWTTNSLTYYGIMMISSSLAGNRFLNFFLGSVVEYPAAFVELSIINRFGRKPTAIFFHALCCISLIIASLLATMAGGNFAMETGSTIFTLVGKFAITGSFSTIFLFTPELYPTNLRNLGIGLSSSAARIGGMISPFSRNLAEMCSWAPGLVFGIMCAIVCILILFVPETNRHELPQTIEECEQWYQDNQFKLPGTQSRKQDRTTRIAEFNQDK